MHIGPTGTPFKGAGKIKTCYKYSPCCQLLLSRVRLQVFAFLCSSPAPVDVVVFLMLSQNIIVYQTVSVTVNHLALFMVYHALFSFCWFLKVNLEVGLRFYWFSSVGTGNKMSKLV
ncbi:hypothetical protein GQ457_04G013620 [Hibiscus cannabinus]